jgi:recombination protein RecA
MTMAAIPSHILSQLQFRHDVAPEVISTGVDDLDGLIEGCPRGRITEIVGPVSSGRTTLLHAIVAEGTRLGEFCAVIDTANSFDPASGQAAGIDLRRLVWIRCNSNAEHAIKAADLLVHSGGFGVIALDLCEAPARITRRIPLSWWYRFRRAIENTPAAFVVLSSEPNAKACASLFLEMKRGGTHFAGVRPFQYLESARFEAVARKPVRNAPGHFEARALR